MLLSIPAVLSPEQLIQVNRLLDEARFVDGKLSAGAAARRVKSNEELPPNEAHMQALNGLVMGSLVRHPVYQNAALPHRVATPFYARYTAGMSYGEHIDDPVMGMGERYRSDIAITVFLSEPESYEGGELTIGTAFGEQSVKLPAGDAVLYPASSRHRVAPVIRGERRVAVTWVQSLVRDPARREILYDLGLARERLLRTTAQAEETSRVDSAYVNLVRMWSEL